MEANINTKKKVQKKPVKILLALPPIPDDELGQSPTILDSFAIVPEFARNIENAGQGYAKLQGKFYRAEQRSQIADGVTKDKKGRKIVVADSDEEEEKQREDGDEADEADGDEEAKYGQKRKKKSREDIEREALLMEDLYGTLGLADKQFEASEADVGKAYKKAALHFHPDKLGDKFTDKDKEVWLKIQKAYETLSDPAKRKKYDSSLPFDEKIPDAADVTDENFYDVFGKCFQNNSRFSEKKPVPNIGDANTPMNEVSKFYKFWDNFKTWREFSQYDEYDTEDAQDRYEKRWMEKQNKKLREKHDKEERKRIMNLTNLSKKNDPRVKEQQAKEQAEKDAKKAESKEAKIKRAKELEEMQRKREEARQKEKDDIENAKQQEKEERKQLQKQYRETTKQLIEFCNEKMPETRYDRFYIEELVKKYPKLQDLQKLLEQVQGIKAKNKEKFIEKFINIVEASDTHAQEKKEQALAKKKEEEKQQQQSSKKKEWSEEDVSMLILTIKKNPPGTANRWKVIAEEVGRQQKDVIEKAKELQNKKQGDVEAKRQEEEELRQKREQMQKEAKEKIAKEAKQAGKPNQNGAAKKVEQKEELDADAWSNEQQKQMEKGMKEVPASVATKERWIKIAEGVDGKTAKECFTRYKELVAKAKSAK